MNNILLCAVVLTLLAGCGVRGCAGPEETVKRPMDGAKQVAAPEVPAETAAPDDPDEMFEIKEQRQGAASASLLMQKRSPSDTGRVAPLPRSNSD